MVGQQLRALIAEAPGSGALEGDDVGRGTAEHPVCGDRVEVDVRLATGTIAALRWRASGCPATWAVAGVAARTLGGVAPGDAGGALHRALALHGGLAVHERHAEAMFLRALAAAVGAAGPG